MKHKPTLLVAKIPASITTRTGSQAIALTSMGDEHELVARDAAGWRLLGEQLLQTLLAAFDAAAGRAGKPLAVVVDYDVGQQRTGTATEEAAVALGGQASSARHSSSGACKPTTATSRVRPAWTSAGRPPQPRSSA